MYCRARFSEHAMRNVLQQPRNAAVTEMQTTKTVTSFLSTTPHHCGKKLFTPGPIGISKQVKEAMLRDIGSRETDFIALIRSMRERLLRIAGVDQGTHTVIPMQGSGTFCLESAFTTVLPRQGAKILIVENGTYGQRLSQICGFLAVESEISRHPENQITAVEDVMNRIGKEEFTHIAMVHCETSSGVINPVEEISQAVKQENKEIVTIVDAMSSFGAIQLDLTNVDVMVTSVNKCLQGVPGFGLVFASKSLLDGCRGNSRSLSFDLVDQDETLERTGQFRFTPPTHAMLAFQKALLEFEAEGGVQGRGARYKQNFDFLNEGMKRIGFEPFLNSTKHAKSYIISSYHYPKHPQFTFKEFYERLYEKGQVIYPGKVTEADCFRIGTIGDIHSEDVQKLLKSIEKVLVEMGMKVPLTDTVATTT